MVESCYKFDIGSQGKRRKARRRRHKKHEYQKVFCFPFSLCSRSLDLTKMQRVSKMMTVSFVPDLYFKNGALPGRPKAIWTTCTETFYEFTDHIPEKCALFYAQKNCATKFTSLFFNSSTLCYFILVENRRTKWHTGHIFHNFSRMFVLSDSWKIGKFSIILEESKL